MPVIQALRKVCCANGSHAVMKSTSPKAWDDGMKKWPPSPKASNANGRAIPILSGSAQRRMWDTPCCTNGKSSARAFPSRSRIGGCPQPCDLRKPCTNSPTKSACANGAANTSWNTTTWIRRSCIARSIPTFSPSKKKNPIPSASCAWAITLPRATSWAGNISNPSWQKSMKKTPKCILNFWASIPKSIPPTTPMSPSAPSRKTKCPISKPERDASRSPPPSTSSRIRCWARWHWGATSSRLISHRCMKSSNPEKAATSFRATTRTLLPPKSCNSPARPSIRK